MMKMQVLSKTNAERNVKEMLNKYKTHLSKTVSTKIDGL